MRVAFLGTPDFAVPTLDALVAAGHELVLVVAQPDKPVGRGQKMASPPTIERARALGIPTAQPKAIRSGPFPERLRALAPDVAVVIAYGRILTADLLAIPTHGCVNVHASLLPRWRGAAPIQAAILAGDPETGVSTQRMAEGLDTGDVYLERRTPIDPQETAGQLHDRLAAMSAEIAVATLAAIAGLTPTPQDEAAATWAPKLDKAMGRLDWNEPADALDRRIRAMSPWPGGFVDRPDGALKVLHATPTAGRAAPGTVLALRPLTVACGAGALVLEQVQAAGRRAVSGSDYANGARLTIGDRL